MKNWTVTLSNGLNLTGKGVLLGVGIQATPVNTVVRIAFKDRNITTENVVNVPGTVTVTEAVSNIGYGGALAA